MTNHRNKQNYRFRTWKFRDSYHLKGGMSGLLPKPGPLPSLIRFSLDLCPVCSDQAGPPYSLLRSAWTSAKSAQISLALCLVCSDQPGPLPSLIRFSLDLCLVLSDQPRPLPSLVRSAWASY